jgi:predicted acetyltransferase
MNDRSNVLASIKAIAEYAITRADMATLENNKYAVATWNHVASNLLDLHEQAEAWDEDTINLIARKMRSEL